MSLLIKDDRSFYAAFPSDGIQSHGEVLKPKSVGHNSSHIHFPALEILNRSRHAPHLGEGPGDGRLVPTVIQKRIGHPELTPVS